MSTIAKTNFGWMVTNTAQLKCIVVKTKKRAIELAAELDALAA